LIEVDDVIDLSPFRAKGKQENEELLPEEFEKPVDLGLGMHSFDLFFFSLHITIKTKEGQKIKTND
jgi:hypothetical protein